MDSPKELNSLTFSLLFTPEMVHHIPVKIHQPEGLRELRVLCPQCNNTRDWPREMLWATTTDDRVIVTLKEYQFTERDYEVDYTRYGWVWINRCMRCNHLLYASKWKVETAIEQILKVGNYNS